MDDSDLLIILAGVAVAVAYWSYSRWRARVVFRKLAGKGKTARKKAVKRLSKEERLIYDHHALRMLQMLAIAFTVGWVGALIVGEISVEADLMLFFWSGVVTRAEHPVGFMILWLFCSIFPGILWGGYFYERRALSQRARRVARHRSMNSSANA